MQDLKFVIYLLAVGAFLAWIGIQAWTMVDIRIAREIQRASIGRLNGN